MNSTFLLVVRDNVHSKVGHGTLAHTAYMQSLGSKSLKCVGLTSIVYSTTSSKIIVQ